MEEILGFAAFTIICAIIIYGIYLIIAETEEEKTIRERNLANKLAIKVAAAKDRAEKFAKLHLIDSTKEVMPLHIIDGDFLKTEANTESSVLRDAIIITDTVKFLSKYGVKYSMEEITSFEKVFEDNRIGAKNVAGWGTTGAILAGPVGAIALGAISSTSDNDNWVQFTMGFKDGKRMLAKVKSKDYAQLSFILSSFASNAA